MLPVDPINQARYVPFHVNHTQEKNRQTKEVTDFLKRDPTQVNFRSSFVNNFKPCLVGDTRINYDKISFQVNFPLSCVCIKRRFDHSFFGQNMLPPFSQLFSATFLHLKGW